MVLITLIRGILGIFLHLCYVLVRRHMMKLAILNLALVILGIIPRDVATYPALFIIAVCADECIEMYASRKITKDTPDEEMVKLVMNTYEKQMAYWLFKINYRDDYFTQHLRYLTELFKYVKYEKIKESQV